jgi:hypothetical protein
LAECAGETGGNTAFWNTVAWIYQHTRGDGAGVMADARLPAMPQATQDCLRSTRPDALIRAQAAAAARDQIMVTPTLRLVDRRTGKALVLQGAIEGDALLSSIDLLASRSSDPSRASR